MKNSDLPITPIVNEHGHPYHSSYVNFDNAPLLSGLTKREHFAGLAMQAYLNGNLAWSDGRAGGAVEVCAEEVAQEAVTFADALLNELGKK